MAQFNLYEAKAKLSSLVEKAAQGEDIIIARAGKPRVRLVPIRDAESARRPGRAKGRILIAANFDAELPREIASVLDAPPRRKRA